jgi:hypothetical protein
MDRGAILWNLTGDIVTRKPGRTLLPVLTVLFVVSYGLLTMLVVEQGRTIDSQRNLIRMLFDDSIELNGMKGKANQKHGREEHGPSPGAVEDEKRRRHRLIR